MTYTTVVVRRSELGLYDSRSQSIFIMYKYFTMVYLREYTDFVESSLSTLFIIMEDNNGGELILSLPNSRNEFQDLDYLTRYLNHT